MKDMQKEQDAERQGENKHQGGVWLVHMDKERHRSGILRDGWEQGGQRKVVKQLRYGVKLQGVGEGRERQTCSETER